MATAAAGIAPLPTLARADDGALVERAREGETWAQEALYRRHVHRVTGVVAKLLRHGPDVEDVVQDTFIEAFQDLPKLRSPDHVGRWIVRIAVHKVHKRFRRRRLRRMLGLDRSLDSEPLAEQAKQDAPQEARAELAILDAALDRMSSAERSCWVLRHLEGYQLGEVAELTGCSLATVKRRLAGAHAVVDEHVQEGRHG